MTATLTSTLTETGYSVVVYTTLISELFMNVRNLDRENLTTTVLFQPDRTISVYQVCSFTPVESGRSGSVRWSADVEVPLRSVLPVFLVGRLGSGSYTGYLNTRLHH